MKTKGRLCEVIGETLVVRLPEELGHHTAGLIREDTEDLFLEKRIRNVIFDYRQTVFMDSSGIGLVMGRYREVRYLTAMYILLVCKTRLHVYWKYQVCIVWQYRQEI